MKLAVGILLVAWVLGGAVLGLRRSTTETVPDATGGAEERHSPPSPSAGPPTEGATSSSIPSNASLSGTLRSASGKYRGPGAMVVVTSESDASKLFFKTAKFTAENGQYVGSFRFDRLPVGRYSVSLRALDNSIWDPPGVSVFLPCTPLQFVCNDLGTKSDLEFVAVDDVTGKPVSEFWVGVWTGSDPHEGRLIQHWETKRFHAVPDTAQVQWMMRARGYRWAFGDAAAFSPVDADRRVARVRLQPGWGQSVLVTTPDDVPLSGVNVVIDGRSRGETNARGVLSVDLDQRPTTLEFVREGLHVSWGNVDLASDRYGFGLETKLYMKPD